LGNKNLPINDAIAPAATENVIHPSQNHEINSLRLKPSSSEFFMSAICLKSPAQPLLHSNAKIYPIEFKAKFSPTLIGATR
jgi:hypothetical protein